MHLNSKSLCKPENIGDFFSSKLMCYLAPFLIFGTNLIYCIARGEITAASGYYLIHFLYTYDHGYISRGLFGEVLSWFFDTITDDLTYKILIVINVLLAISCALFIGKMLSTVREDKGRFAAVYMLFLSIFVLAGPLDFYYTDLKLDKLVWALTFFCVFLVSNKIGIWFVPVICVITTMINPVFLFCSMILIAIILLQEFYQNGFSLKNGIICGVSYISMIGVGLLAPISEKWIGFETPAEMIDFYFSRYVGNALDESTYQAFETDWLFDFFEPVDEIIRIVYAVYNQEWGNGSRTILIFLLLALPVYVLLTMFWKKAIQCETNKFQKFIYFLCAISPIVVIPPVIISWEFSKYFYNNILVQTGLIMYFIAKGCPAILDTINKLLTYCKTHLPVVTIGVSYFIMYIAIFGSR